MTTQNTIGICNECGNEYPETSPFIGGSCPAEVMIKEPQKDGTIMATWKKCRGIVVRHRVIREIVPLPVDMIIRNTI